MFELQASKHDCTAHSALYTPGTNEVRPLFVFTDTWCSSGQFRADGTLVQTGGNLDGFSKVMRNLSIMNSTLEVNLWRTWLQGGRARVSRRSETDQQIPGSCCSGSSSQMYTSSSRSADIKLMCCWWSSTARLYYYFLQIRTFTPCASGGDCNWVETETNLQQGRWYASNQQLPDGTAIVVGGRGAFTAEFVPANGRGQYHLPLLTEVCSEITPNY